MLQNRPIDLVLGRLKGVKRNAPEPLTRSRVPSAE